MNGVKIFKTKENNQAFVGVAEAARICGMHPHTLRKYANEGKIKGYKTPSGQTKFNRSYLEEMCSCVPVIENVSKPVGFGEIPFSGNNEFCWKIFCYQKC